MFHRAIQKIKVTPFMVHDVVRLVTVKALTPSSS